MNWFDHFLLWFAFFGTGGALGFIMAWILVVAGGGKRI